MEEALQFIQQHITIAPWLIMGLLLLAGLNIPVSEDVMLFTSATLASYHPERTAEFFIAVFIGAYGSDLICYSLGRKLGPKLWNIKWFAKMVSKESVNKLNSFYEKYGVFTLILGRFIPFGVRNGLFLTAGLGKMNFIKFALSDLTACIISTCTFFTLYFYYGKTVISYVRQGNIFLFCTASVIVTILLIKKHRAKKTPPN